jgi:hypothetical protein
MFVTSGFAFEETHLSLNVRDIGLGPFGTFNEYHARKKRAAPAAALVGSRPRETGTGGVLRGDVTCPNTLPKGSDGLHRVEPRFCARLNPLASLWLVREKVSICVHDVPNLPAASLPPVSAHGLDLQ